MPSPGYIRSFSVFIVLSVCALIMSCGGGSSTGGTQVTVPTNQPTFAHVALVMLENRSFSEVIGNTSMPYFNSLAQQYGLAAQYYANTHPSLPNYFMITTGQLETTDDSFAGTVTDDNAVREIVKAGKTWKCYAEALPSPAYLGGDAYPYIQHHNPFAYLSDVQQSATQAANIVPFTQFSSDLANNSLPQYAFILPDMLDDAHDGTLAQADAWLKTNIAPLLASTAFQSGGLLIITFDEGDASDSTNGGGQVATLIISSASKKNYTSQTLYQHQSALRLMLLTSGVTSLPGEAATAPDMNEFFTGQ